MLYIFVKMKKNKNLTFYFTYDVYKQTESIYIENFIKI